MRDYYGAARYEPGRKMVAKTMDECIQSLSGSKKDVATPGQTGAAAPH